MKKLVLSAASAALLCAGATAQNAKQAQVHKVDLNVSAASQIPQNYIRCGTPTPGPEWDNWFNGEVEKFKQQLAMGKATVTSYTIPVIVHIIHGGQAVGTFPNISQGQINSQITVLNQDYSGTGFNVGNVPAVFSTLVANTGIQFCMATKDPSGNTLAEPGIERINYTSKGWPNPASSTYNTTTAFMNLIDGTIKPGSIWNPAKYMNMWVTDENASVGLLGYATFPAGTTLTGIPGGTGTATTDGFWAWAKSFGSQNIYAGGAYAPPYNYGRTCSHEIGHYLGLRHIWGDGTCVTDYCNDTPPAQQANFSCTSGCTNGCFTNPYQSGVCSGNTTGDMTMNFMDYTDDKCMYMFTPDQTTRIQTAMQTGTYRTQLSASSVTECGLSSTVPVAAFTFPSPICAGTAAMFTDASSGPPTSWSWSVTPTATITTSTSQNPNITFGTTGTYSVTLTATNSNGSNSITHTVSVTSCTVSIHCPDTMNNFKNTDTLTVYTAGTDTATPGCSPHAGYVVGTNCYGDKEKAEWYDITKYSALTNPKITDVLVLFFKNGTIGTGGNSATAVNLNIYNGTSSGGPSGAALATVNSTLGAITAVTPVTGVPYCGNPALAFGTAIILPYKYHLSSPLTPPATNGFFASVVLPQGPDTAAIFSNRNATANTGWEYWSNNTWNSMFTAWGSLNVNIAILPIFSCTNGINANNPFANNISIFPNPSSGHFNFAVTLAEATNLNFRVVNTLGQTVFSKTENNVMNTVLSYDLSSLAKGVYFVNITDSQNNSTIKKIIIE